MSPRADVRQQRRQAIIEAAWAVIVERGLQHARVIDIARRAGVSNGSVHYYFADKDELMAQAVRLASERAFARFTGALAEVDDPRERLDLVGALQVPDGPVADEWTIWLETWNASRHSPELAELSRRIYQQWVRSVADIISEGQRRGDFAADDAHDLAAGYVGLIDGLGLQAYLDPAPERREVMRRLLARYVERRVVGGADV